MPINGCVNGSLSDTKLCNVRKEYVPVIVTFNIVLVYNKYLGNRNAFILFIKFYILGEYMCLFFFSKIVNNIDLNKNLIYIIWQLISHLSTINT